MVVAEQGPEGVAPVSLELVSCARALAAGLGGEIRLAVLGEKARPLAEEAARRAGCPVTVVRAPGLREFQGEAWREILAPLLAAWGARAVLAAHTTSGLDWLPGLAARLGAACVTGVEALAWAGGALTLTRTTLFGKALEALRPEASPLALTVQPGAFPAAGPAEGPEPTVEQITAEAPALCSRLLEAPEGPARDQALARARVVVAAGRGVGRPENLDLVRRLAARFSGAALAGSRPVCDLGWLGYQSQVGQTGAAVAPRLYIACGISGARQHTMGMQGSGFIVAVNSDPRAAIFNLADVCVVEDLVAFIPAFLARCGEPEAMDPPAS